MSQYNRPSKTKNNECASLNCKQREPRNQCFEYSQICLHDKRLYVCLLSYLTDIRINDIFGRANIIKILSYSRVYFSL